MCFSSADVDFNLMFQKINLSTDSESKAARDLLTVPPAVEKTRSEGTDVAGEYITLWASFDRLG